jgi:hypothetical protein
LPARKPKSEATRTRASLLATSADSTSITTFDAVHDQASPRNVLRGILISLADDGVYFAQDIKASSDVQHNRKHLLGPLLYTISCMHCMTVSLAQGGDGLGAMWARRWRCSHYGSQSDGRYRTHPGSRRPRAAISYRFSSAG